jgi:hypothetical protein
MATQAKTRSSKSTDAQALPGRVLQVAREAGHGLLDTAEQTGKGIAELQEGVGESSGVEVISTVSRTQAGVTRNVVKAYVSAGRKLVG